MLQFLLQKQVIEGSGDAAHHHEDISHVEHGKAHEQHVEHIHHEAAHGPVDEVADGPRDDEREAGHGEGVHQLLADEEDQQHQRKGSS